MAFDRNDPLGVLDALVSDLVLRGAVPDDAAKLAVDPVRGGRNPSSALLEVGAHPDDVISALGRIAGIPSAPPRSQWDLSVRNQLGISEGTWRRLSAVPIGLSGTRPLVAFADLVALSSPAALALPDHAACVALEADVVDALAYEAPAARPAAVAFLAPPAAVERSLKVGASAFRPGTQVPERPAQPEPIPLATPARGPGIGPGVRCGRFLLERELGRGGMATVYLGTAVDGQAPHKAAVKVVHPHLLESSGEELRSRFRREVEVMQRLHHPNVVAYLEGGRVGDTEYVATEFAGGGSLKQMLLKAPKLPPSLALLWLEQMLDALAHAHQMGIIHRDLKPDNLLLAEDGTLKIADYGIARVAEGTQLTATGGTLGTPAYMSPEQALARKLDARSDLFSTGIIVYELLTGRNPFRADSMAATMGNIAAAQAPPVGEIEPAVPLLLDFAVTRLLAQRPDDRFSSAELARAALEPLRERSQRFKPMMASLVARTPEALSAAFALEGQLFLETARQEKARGDRLRASMAAFRAGSLTAGNREAESLLASMTADGAIRLSRSLSKELSAREEGLGSLPPEARPAAYREVAAAYLAEGNPIFGGRYARRALAASGVNEANLSLLARVLPDAEVDGVRSLPARVGQSFALKGAAAAPPRSPPAPVLDGPTLNIPARSAPPLASSLPAQAAPVRPAPAAAAPARSSPRPGSRSKAALGAVALAAIAFAAGLFYFFGGRGGP